MNLVIVADAKQTNSDRHILKNESAKIRNKWLNANPQRIKVVAIRDVAQMHVGEQFLNCQMRICALLALTRIDSQAAHFIDERLVYLEHRHEAEFIIRRLERGVALDHADGQNQRLDKNGLSRTCELIVGTWPQ